MYLQADEVRGTLILEFFGITLPLCIVNRTVHIHSFLSVFVLVDVENLTGRSKASVVIGYINKGYELLSISW